MLLTHNRGATRKRLRRILSELVGPAQAEDMREEVSRVVSRLLDTLPDTSFDLKHDFTDLVPASVYCSWVNAPPSHARFVADMSETVLSIFQRNPELTPTIVNAYDELFAYALQRLDERESARGDDFLSKLLACRDRGDLSETELEDYAVMLIEASTDNTSHQLAITVDRLLNIPGLWPTLANDRHQVSDIIQEVMRLWPRSISTSRTALEETEFGGVSLPRGTSIFACFGACHRQADKFYQPHEFNPNRVKTPSHLNFGGGALSCLGQFIANIEMEERWFNLPVDIRT
jgi:cytochrome P450